MKCLIIVAAIVHVTLAGHVNVQTYAQPSGINYLSGPAAYTPGLTYTHPSSLTTSTYYGNGHFLGRVAHQAYAPAPVVHSHAVPAPVVQTQHVASAVVPTVHHLPAVADVPVTKYEAQQGFIQKELDVAKPAVKTSKYELRRPAIQKEFFDIEERVIVRPAGSAVVELDQPHSKVQKSSVVSPVAPHFAPAHFAPAHFAPVHFAPAHFNPAHFSPGFIPAQQPIFDHTPRPNPADQGVVSNDDSIVVEARRRPEGQQPLQRNSYTNQNYQNNIQSLQNNQQEQHQQQEQQTFQRFGPGLVEEPIRSLPAPVPQPIPHPEIRSRVHAKTIEEQSDTQQRLIELLTARHGVADVGFGAPVFRNVGDAGQVRARVLSAEHSPKDAPATGERVNTRRVVVSRPIETIEEVDVVEPVTKLERVAVQHPAIFKTAHVGLARVPTSVPVLGKAIAPVIQKTVSAPVLAHQQVYYH